MSLTPRTGLRSGSSGLTIMTSSNPRLRFTLPSALDPARRDAISAADHVELRAAGIARQGRWRFHEVNVRPCATSVTAVRAVDHALQPADHQDLRDHPGAPPPTRVSRIESMERAKQRARPRQRCVVVWPATTPAWTADGDDVAHDSS